MARYNKLADAISAAITQCPHIGSALVARRLWEIAESKQDLLGFLLGLESTAPGTVRAGHVALHRA